MTWILKGTRRTRPRTCDVLDFVVMIGFSERCIDYISGISYVNIIVTKYVLQEFSRVEPEYLLPEAIHEGTSGYVAQHIFTCGHEKLVEELHRGSV